VLRLNLWRTAFHILRLFVTSAKVLLTPDTLATPSYTSCPCKSAVHPSLEIYPLYITQMMTCTECKWNTLPVSGSILSSSRHVVILSMYNTLVMLSNEMLVTEFAYTLCTNMVLRCNVINDSLYCASFQQHVKFFWETEKMEFVDLWC
jgi:hypothetical protein